jgi:hypothetical protein
LLDRCLDRNSDKNREIFRLFSDSVSGRRPTNPVARRPTKTPPKTSKKAAGSTSSEVLKTTKKVAKKLAEMPVWRDPQNHEKSGEKTARMPSAAIEIKKFLKSLGQK